MVAGNTKVDHHISIGDSVQRVKGKRDALLFQQDELNNGIRLEQGLLQAVCLSERSRTGSQLACKETGQVVPGREPGGVCDLFEGCF